MTLPLPFSLPEIVVHHPLNDAVLYTSPAAVIADGGYSVTYDNAAKLATARFKDRGLRYARPPALWKGDAYTAAGEFTDSQVDARVAELLGTDPVAVLTALIQLPILPPMPVRA